MDLYNALRLQIEWGADEALADRPIDRRAVPAPAAPMPAASGPVDRIVTIPDLAIAMAAFDGCDLRHTAGHLLFAAGTATARLMLIGDHPEADDDRSGQFCAGAAGRLLDRMLAAIGLDRHQVWLANLVPWRPPGGRRVQPDEIAACLPFLQRLVQLARPSHLVLCGGLVARHLAGLEASPRHRQPVWLPAELPGLGTLPVLPMPAPSLLLDHPSRKKEAWAKLLAVRAALAATEGG